VLTCKITLPDSPQPQIISKNPGFQALYLAKQYEFRFTFNKYKNSFFFILAAGFWPKNLAFARKMALPESGGLQPPCPLAHMFMIRMNHCY